MISKDHYCQSPLFQPASLFAKWQTVCPTLIQSALYHCLAQKISRLYFVSWGKPLMNTARAARVETRKLKQTHLWSHTMTDVLVCVCVRGGGFYNKINFINQTKWLQKIYIFYILFIFSIIFFVSYFDYNDNSVEAVEAHTPNKPIACAAWLTVHSFQKFLFTVPTGCKTSTLDKWNHTQDIFS